MKVIQSYKDGSMPIFTFNSLWPSYNRVRQYDFIYNHTNVDDKYLIMICETYIDPNDPSKTCNILQACNKDPAFDGLIGWSSNGNSITVKEQVETSKLEDADATDFYIVCESKKIHMINVKHKFEILASGDDPNNEYFQLYNSPQIPEEEFIGKVAPLTGGLQFILGNHLITWGVYSGQDFYIFSKTLPEALYDALAGTSRLDEKPVIYLPIEINISEINEAIEQITVYVEAINEQLSKVSKYFITR